MHIRIPLARMKRCPSAPPPRSYPCQKGRRWMKDVLVQKYYQNQTIILLLLIVTNQRTTRPWRIGVKTHTRKVYSYTQHFLGLLLLHHHPSSHSPWSVLGNFRLKGFKPRHPRRLNERGRAAVEDNMLNRVTSQFIKCIQHIKCILGERGGDGTGTWFTIGKFSQTVATIRESYSRSFFSSSCLDGW